MVWGPDHANVLSNIITSVATALFIAYNGGFGIKTDIIQINLWNRRTNEEDIGVKSSFLTDLGRV